MTLCSRFVRPAAQTTALAGIDRQTMANRTKKVAVAPPSVGVVAFSYAPPARPRTLPNRRRPPAARRVRRRGDGRLRALRPRGFLLAARDLRAPRRAGRRHVAPHRAAHVLRRGGARLRPSRPRDRAVGAPAGAPQAPSIELALSAAEPPFVCLERVHAVGVTGGLRGPREVAVVRDEPQRMAAHRLADVERDPLVPPQVADARRVRVGTVERELLPYEGLELNSRGGALQHARDERVGEWLRRHELGVLVRLPDDVLRERPPRGGRLMRPPGRLHGR